MNDTAETEHADIPTFEAARYGASQALMHLQLAEPFARVTWTNGYNCETEVDPQSSTPGNRARVSLAGLACFLMGEIVELQDEFPAGRIGVVSSVVGGWVVQVKDGEGADFPALSRAEGYIEDQMEWVTAFYLTNEELIDEATTVLIKANGEVSYSAFEPQFRGRVQPPTDEYLAYTSEMFSGESGRLEDLDEIIRASRLDRERLAALDAIS